MRTDENALIFWQRFLAPHRFLIRFSQPTPDTGWVRVLVVEDHAAMAEAISRGLIAEGFAVDLACDGDEGLWRAREFPYDVIVLDIMLPGMNGYEICRTLRAEEIATPILILTAKSGEYDEAEGLDLGADDYLSKPFSFVVLVARIRALARRSNPLPTSDVLTMGDLCIDTARRQCTIAGHAVELTAREYSLLETMARRPGVPLTRRELLDHVWGADHQGGSNVVDVYIGYLRRKLAAAPRELIETVRGVGYRIAVQP